jgi:dihydropteroate synthase
MLSRPRYINAGGRLIDLEIPRVMGIINVTPDSFYSGSRFSDEQSVAEAAGSMLSEGADILDVGGYSSRPGADDISVEEERKRTIGAIKLIMREFPQAIVSVDTFRAGIAREAVEEAGALLINDISGGDADTEMFSVVRKLNVPYIIMHMQGTPATMQKDPHYDDIVADILKYLAVRILRLRESGVSDIIIDPGFGFGKTISHNFELLDRLSEFRIAGLPLLAGLSRKSMVWKSLGITAEEALNGTTVLNSIALMNGADILRVHDVAEAVQAVRLYAKLRKLT